MIAQSPVRAGREFAFTKADFERICRLIYHHAGITLTENKQEMVYSRLVRRLRARNLRCFSDYLKLLEANDPVEREAFINSLTTNLTYFFREAHHFPVLADNARTWWHSRHEPLTIWCCAASTGEEPYSIAMTLVDALGSLTPPATILASDVDTSVLAKGAAGVYGAESINKLDASLQRRFFQADPASGGAMVRVRDELRKLITFRRVNLLDSTWPVRGRFDVIFCRNVMIYFDKPTQRRVLERFLPLLRDDGLLFAGHSESFYHAADLFRLQGKTVYGPVVRKIP